MGRDKLEDSEASDYERVSEDYDLHQEWAGSGEHLTSEGPRSTVTLEFRDANELYAANLHGLVKSWPPTSGWRNWYSESQTLVYRRWSTFDLALGRWVAGFLKPLKKELEAFKFCENTNIDPIPHYRYIYLPYSGDVLRPNLGVHMEGLDELARLSFSVQYRSSVNHPAMVFQVACRETLEAARDDMWRYLWMTDRCRIGIIFIVNTFYDQHLKPFQLSMEVWTRGMDDMIDVCKCPLPDPPSNSTSDKDETQNESAMDDDDVSIGSFQWVNEWVENKPVLKRNEDGFLTYQRFTLKPAAREPLIIMRHREEIVVIDDTKEEVDLLKEIEFFVADFIPLCGAKLDQLIEAKTVNISLDSLRDCVRQEWYYCHTPASSIKRPKYQWNNYNDRLAEAYAPRHPSSWRNFGDPDDD